MAKKKVCNIQEVGINEVRAKIRQGLIERYGSVAKFLASPDSNKFGGRKMRTYLYDKGPVSFDVLSKLSTWLGIGTLSRELIVTRSVKYHLQKDKEDTSEVTK